MSVPTVEGHLWVEDRVMPAVVVLAGPLDVDLAAELRRVLRRLTERERPDVLVDLSKVDSVDSVGLGVLAAAYCRARSSGGRVTALAARPAVSRAMRLAGLGELLWEGAPRSPLSTGRPRLR